MQGETELRALTRRELLAKGIAVGALLVAGPGFVAHTSEAWAVEVKALAPATMATLIKVARDIYPHDRIADEFYAIAVQPHDAKASEDAGHKALIEGGIATLDTLAGSGGYAGLGWEADRVRLLQQIEATPFFQTVRGGLVVGLYNQKAIWPKFGYEGASHDKGGYLERGFDDIAWL